MSDGGSIAELACMESQARAARVGACRMETVRGQAAQRRYPRRLLAHQQGESELTTPR